MSATSPARTRAVIYTRVSLDRTGEGESNKRQEEACRMLCSMRGWVVVDTFEDMSVSAYSDVQRDGWENVLTMMRTGQCDVVVAWKMDRVTRTVAGLVDLVMLSRETGVSLATTDGMLDLTTPSGKAVATILAAVAEMEVELKAERQRLANKQRRDQGEPWRSGFKSFGYTLDGKVVEPEAALIRSGAQAFLDGRSLGQIAADWQASGTKPRSGRAWRNTSVRTILANPRLAGLMTFGGEVTGVRGKWEAILSDETHRLIAARLADPSRRQGGSKFGPKAENLLTGIAVCASCSETVFGRGNDGTGQPAYRCPGSHVMTARTAADDIVVAGIELASQVLPPGTVLSIPRAGETASLSAAITVERVKLQELSESHAAGRLPLAALEASAAVIEERIADLEQQFTGDGAPYDPRKLNDAAIADFKNLDLGGQRAVLSRIARISLHPKGRGRKGVPITEQVVMDVRVVDADGAERWLPVLRGAADDVPARTGQVLSQPSDFIYATVPAFLEDSES